MDIVGTDIFDLNTRLAAFICDREGGFGAARHSGIPSGSMPIALLDVDADGQLDVVVRIETSIQVLRGDGAGHFRPLGTFAVAGSEQRTVRVADVDADGRDDLLLATEQGVAMLPGSCASPQHP